MVLAIGRPIGTFVLRGTHSYGKEGPKNAHGSGGLRGISEMSEELQIQQQQQITDLSVDTASLRILVEQSLEKYGDGQRMVKALHQRFDKIEDTLDKRIDKLESELKDIDSKVLTREERKQELEDIVNAKVGSWVIKALGTLMAAMVAGVVAWFNGLFSGVS